MVSMNPDRLNWIGWEFSKKLITFCFFPGLVQLWYKGKRLLLLASYSPYTALLPKVEGLILFRSFISFLFVRYPCFVERMPFRYPFSSKNEFSVCGDVFCALAVAFLDLLFACFQSRFVVLSYLLLRVSPLLFTFLVSSPSLSFTGNEAVERLGLWGIASPYWTTYCVPRYGVKMGFQHL